MVGAVVALVVVFVAAVVFFVCRVVRAATGDDDDEVVDEVSRSDKLILSLSLSSSAASRCSSASIFCCSDRMSLFVDFSMILSIFMVSVSIILSTKLFIIGWSAFVVCVKSGGKSFSFSDQAWLEIVGFEEYWLIMVCILDCCSLYFGQSGDVAVC